MFCTIIINMYGQDRKFLLSLNWLKLILQKYLHQSQEKKSIYLVLFSLALRLSFYSSCAYYKTDDYSSLVLILVTKLPYQKPSSPIVYKHISMNY